MNNYLIYVNALETLATYLKNPRNQDIAKAIESLDQYTANIKQFLTSKIQRIYLQGPDFIYEFRSEKYNKIIYIFGDTHKIETKCSGNKSVKLDKFINKSLDANKGKIIEFYLEQNSKNSFKYIANHITNLKRQLELRSDKNIKIYDIDIRPTLFPNQLKQIFYNYSFNDEKLHKSDLESNILGLQSEEVTKFLTNIFEQPIIKNTISLIINPEIRDSIKKYFSFLDRENILEIRNNLIKVIKDEILPVKKRYPEYSGTIDENNLPKNTNQMTEYTTFLQLQYSPIIVPEVIHEEYYKYSNTFYESISSIMDLYTVSKIFSSSETNTIIYAGTYHGYFYEKFLSYLGFKNEYTVCSLEDGNFQCTDITFLKQPLFSS